MSTWGDYGLAGLVLGVVLYMQRSQVKYIQDLTDRMAQSQIDLVHFMESKYEDDLNTISAALIIIKDREESQLRLQEKIADSQIQITTAQQSILENQRMLLERERSNIRGS